MLQNAVTEGATVTSVNIMVFDYYLPTRAGADGRGGENAATSARTQLQSIFPA